MTWLHAHTNRLNDVFNEAKDIVRQFPSPMDQLGLAYLAKFDASQEGSTKNYICYLLPYWMEDICELPAAAFNKLSLANVFVMLYYFIQDDIMDSSKGNYANKLPLANLFHMRFLAIYRELFPSDSPFWGYYETYISEWAQTVSNEGHSDYFHNDLMQIAKKASPVKNASTGALLLSDQAYLIPEVTAAVEQALVTLQMLDDWADWEEDLEEGSYNCLLAGIQKRLQLAETNQLTLEMIKQQIYVHDYLEAYGEIAVHHHERLLRLPHAMDQLFGFHDSLVQNILRLAQEIKDRRSALASGGFYYFLSNSERF
ncbi:hypothetical protein A8709_03450 [Paenibacillus pectinilyticus]|uniref:Terpene synthase n=1 Tax=Paenibacillus pectinilyticus TaxID=512399 RepID=A0A1C0ZYW4_9BACL|nr:hypothetical protein [Paenibacillus pectinilyticus]OCT13323.1 hypothetical protein A8709_03450 [Paenibacillus pectinilyticus]